MGQDGPRREPPAPEPKALLASRAAGMTDRGRLSILLLCDDRRSHANTVLDHIASLTRWSRHRVEPFNPYNLSSSRFLDLDAFDVVVIHYSILIVSDEHLAPSFRNALAGFRGLKVQFIQDEYRRVEEIGAMMRRLGIHAVFTLVPEKQIPKIWSEARVPGVLKVPTLAGYVPDSLLEATGAPLPLESRPIDVGYRGREVPWWLGELGQEKVRIGRGFLERAAVYGLRCDIAWTEDRRIYGADWIQFIRSCRAVLGTESGASITDFDGSIEAAVKRYRSEHPSATFEEVHHAVLAPFEGNARIRVISPRVFEAAALRTALVLFPGDYSGILQPWVHYIPLAKNFSNLSEVVEKIRDLVFLRELTERTHADLVASGRYSGRALAREFDDLVDHLGRRSRKGIRTGLRLARIERLVRRDLPDRTGLTTLVRVWRPTSIALRLVLRDRGLSSILLRYAGDRRARSETTLRDLMMDFLRFGILARVLKGDVVAGDRFRIVASFDSKRSQLSFVSLPVDAGPKGLGGRVSAEHERTLDSTEAALKGGGLAAIVWNHSLVGRSIRAPGGATVGLGDDGVHCFRAIEKVALRFPNEVWRTLKPLLNASTTSRP